MQSRMQSLSYSNCARRRAFFLPLFTQEARCFFKVFLEALNVLRKKDERIVSSLLSFAEELRFSNPEIFLVIYCLIDIEEIGSSTESYMRGLNRITLIHSLTHPLSKNSYQIVC